MKLKNHHLVNRVILGIAIVLGIASAYAGSTSYVVTGPGIPLPGYFPNPTSAETLFDVTSDGTALLLGVGHWPDPHVGIRTWDATALLWAPRQVLFPCSGPPSFGPERIISEGATIFYVGDNSFWRSAYSAGSWLPGIKVLDE